MGDRPIHLRDVRSSRGDAEIMVVDVGKHNSSDDDGEDEMHKGPGCQNSWYSPVLQRISH